MEAHIGADGLWRMEAMLLRASLGRGGVRGPDCASGDKQEGDGATPVGLLALRRVLYRPDRLPSPACKVPVKALSPADGWCDDPAHAAYNRPVRLPFNASAEALWRADSVYDIIGILGWNDHPVRPGRGSAIFLHVARLDYAATEGCVALALDELQQVLAIGLTEILVRV